jgi:DNA-binding transcriptional LysR family regulator
MHSRAADWDDLRVVDAIAREGSLAGAARRLRVRHSTVFRRLAAIEKKMGVRLFERLRDGYAPMPAGERVARLAARFADEVLSLERELAGQDLRPSGAVRIATTDSVAAIIMRHVRDLRASHPAIKIEVTISNAMANLTRREADVALRPTPEPPQNLVGRRVAHIAHSIYGSRDYLSGQRRDLTDLYWVGLDDALADTVIGRWMGENVSDERITCRVDALPALRDAAVVGLGIALLPCYLGDTAAELERVAPETMPEPRSALWLLTHDDLKRTARIRATMEALGLALTSDRDLLEGRRPSMGYTPRT